MNILMNRAFKCLLLSWFALIGAANHLTAQPSPANTAEALDRFKSIDLMSKAARRSEKKDWSGAMHYINQAIVRDRSRPDALSGDYSVRADFWAEMGNYRNSLSDRARAIKLDPAEAYDCYAEQARVRAKFHDLDKALADAEMALQLKPDCSPCIQIRGEVRFARKEYDLAIGDYNRSMELNHDNGNAPAALKLRAEVYRAQGKIDLAEADEKIYNEGILKNGAMMIAARPDQASVYYRLQGEYRSGIRKEHTAIGELPTRMKEYDKAIEDFTNALKINPKDRLALKDRAEVYRILGKIDLAKADERAYRATAPRSSRSKKH